jgi:hypothetical protein
VIAKEADEPTKDDLRKGKRSIHSVYQKLHPPKPKTHKPVNEPELPEPGDHETFEQFIDTLTGEDEEADGHNNIFTLNQPMVIPDPFAHDPDEVAEHQEMMMARWLQSLLMPSQKRTAQCTHHPNHIPAAVSAWMPAWIQNQVIIQAKADDFPTSWHLAVEERLAREAGAQPSPEE